MAGGSEGLRNELCASISSHRSSLVNAFLSKFVTHGEIFPLLFVWSGLIERKRFSFGKCLLHESHEWQQRRKSVEGPGSWHVDTAQSARVWANTFRWQKLHYFYFLPPKDGWRRWSLSSLVLCLPIKTRIKVNMIFGIVVLVGDKWEPFQKTFIKFKVPKMNRFTKYKQ